jgi:hypothetical protein
MSTLPLSCFARRQRRSPVKVPQKLLSEIELRFKIWSQRNSFSRAERMVPLIDCGPV